MKFTADLAGKVLELAGSETTSQRELFERFRSLSSRTPSLVVLPGALVSAGARMLEALHFTPPITEDQVTMYEEGNVLLGGGRNELREVLHIEPLPLRDGLALMAYATPEQLPASGTGTLVRRRFWAEIEGATMTPEETIALVQRDFQNLVPEGAASVGNEELSSKVLAPGATITLTLPLRGNVQIRVEEVTPRTITCVTLLGHPLAGVVRFLGEIRGSRLRFGTGRSMSSAIRPVSTAPVAKTPRQTASPVTNGSTPRLASQRRLPGPNPDPCWAKA